MQATARDRGAQAPTSKVASHVTDGGEVRAFWRCTNVDRWLKHMQGRAAEGRKKLSPLAKLAMLEIANFDEAFFSIPYLAELLERGESAARDAVDELVDVGLVRREVRFDEETGEQISNRYEVVDPPPAEIRTPAPAEVRTRPGAKNRTHKQAGAKRQVEARAESTSRAKVLRRPPVEKHRAVSTAGDACPASSVPEGRSEAPQSSLVDQVRAMPQGDDALALLRAERLPADLFEEALRKCVARHARRPMGNVAGFVVDCALPDARLAYRDRCEAEAKAKLAEAANFDLTKITPPEPEPAPEEPPSEPCEPPEEVRAKVAEWCARVDARTPRPRPGAKKPPDEAQLRARLASYEAALRADPMRRDADTLRENARRTLAELESLTLGGGEQTWPSTS